MQEEEKLVYMTLQKYPVALFLLSTLMPIMSDDE